MAMPIPKQYWDVAAAWGITEFTEWCRRELGSAGFELVHAGFQGGAVRFEGVDVRVELGI